MRKTLLALAMVLMLAPMAFAQQGPSPHSVDFEALYFAAQISGADVAIGTTEDAAGEPKDVVIVKTNVTGAPFVVRGVYRYRHELGIGGQFYQISASGTADEDQDAWAYKAVNADITPPPPGGGIAEVMEGSTAVRLSAMDLYHVQNIARTSESNYDLIGGFRWADTSMNVVISNKGRDLFPAIEEESTVTGKLFGPHIGITGSKRFLVDPLRLTAAITHSLLQDKTTAAAERSEKDNAGGTVPAGTWNKTAWTETAPVQVTEVEVALRFSSPRMVGMGGSIGYLSSQWENVGARAGMTREGPTGAITRADLGVQGWRAGINFTF